MEFLINARMIAAIYLDCFNKTLQLSARYWWVLVTLFAYYGIFIAMGFITAPLGIIGGFLMGLTMDACLSSFLVMVESMVKGQRRITWEDFKSSFGTYFFSVMGIFFFLWIISIVLRPLTSQFLWVQLAVQLTIYILLNPMPELLYIGKYQTLDLFMRSYEFIMQNWIEWFIPNLLLGGIFYLFWTQVTFPFSGILKPIIMAFLLYFFMIFRGLLFQGLHRSSRRQRMFQYRARQT